MVRFAVLAFALCGCTFVTNTLTSGFTTNDFSGDPFPIYVDSTSGGILLGMKEGTDTHTAVLDVMSPLTLIDRGPDAPVAKTDRDLILLGERGAGGPVDLPRAEFPDKSTVTLHPCENAACTIGRVDDPRLFDALFGLDSFAGDALRLRLGSDEIFVLPDIAGSELHRGRSCDAVLPQPYRGGGTLLLGGTEVDFSNFRVAIDTCIAPKVANTTTQAERGVDALLVASTALGVTILNVSTYERYHQFDPTTPALAALPPDIVYLPSGPIGGRLTEIPSIALVGNSSGNPRSPCRQVWASHLLAARDCNETDGQDCPCGIADTFCGAPAIVELAPPTMIPVLVVDDADPVLQALRAELRPDRPEVDGILGIEALRALELDIDYAHDRMMARCTDRTSCAARPVLADQAARTYINGCLGDQPGPIQ